MSNDRVRDYQNLFTTCHSWLQGTTADLNNETASYLPPGRVLPAGAHYIHHAVAEDLFLNQAIQGKTPLVASTFAGKAGFDKEYPLDGPWTDWARTIDIDMDQARDYVTAVFASTDEFLAGLNDDDLDKTHDLSIIGFGVIPLSQLLSIIAIDGGAHCGEISAVKGLQDMQGYPF